MGNLEKLGILVIVILVVVVGVVAITPSETLFPADATAQLRDDAGDAGAMRLLDPSPDPDPELRDWPFPAPDDTQDDAGLPQLIDPPVAPPLRELEPPTPEPEPEPEPTPRPAPAPDTHTYAVKSGDSLFKIAADLLGDGNRWREIAKVNPGLDASRIRPGQKIQIPGSGSRAPTDPPRAETPRSDTGSMRYTVKRGDTLAGIARELLPSRSWRELLEANSDVLGSPDELRPDMRLRIPGSSAGNSPDSESGPSSGGRVYVVESGDTLGAIARRELGSEGQWKRLLEHNADVLTDPRRLRPGMRLRIPE